jgi:hypothetical protein
MEAVDAAVLEGRDPAWREWWEERLDQASRTRVENAVKYGKPLKEPSLQPFVYGLIARKKRRLRWKIPQLVFLVALSMWWAYSTRIPFFRLFFVVLLILEFTLIPWRLREESRQLARAEQALGSVPLV